MNKILISVLVVVGIAGGGYYFITQENIDTVASYLPESIASFIVPDKLEVAASEPEVFEPELEVSEPETEVSEPETEVSEPETEVSAQKTYNSNLNQDQYNNTDNISNLEQNQSTANVIKIHQPVPTRNIATQEEQQVVEIDAKVETNLDQDMVQTIEASHVQQVSKLNLDEIAQQDNDVSEKIASHNVKIEESPEVLKLQGELKSVQRDVMQIDGENKMLQARFQKIIEKNRDLAIELKRINDKIQVAD